jgi:hypothetical protein
MRLSKLPSRTWRNTSADCGLCCVPTRRCMHEGTISAGLHASPVRPISLRAGASAQDSVLPQARGMFRGPHMHCNGDNECPRGREPQHHDAFVKSHVVALSWSDLSVSGHCHIHAQIIATARAQTMPSRITKRLASVVVPSVTPRRNTRLRVASRFPQAPLILCDTSGSSRYRTLAHPRLFRSCR